MQRSYTRLAVIGFWTLFLVGCGPNGCGGGGASALPPTPTPTPSQPMYVAESGLDQVAVVDAATGVTRMAIPVGKAPVKMSFDRFNNPGINDASSLWVANSGSNTVTRIDTRTNTVTATIRVGSAPVSIYANYDGSRKVWVANEGSNSISIIDKATNTVVATVPTAGSPFQLAAGTPDGNVIPIAETNSSVQLLDPNTNKIVQTITMTAPISGVLCEFVESCAIETSDGVLHVYQQGGTYPTDWPWTNVGTVTLPDGSGPLSDARDDSTWMVSSQSTNQVQIMGSPSGGSISGTQGSIHAFAVGTAPEYADRSEQTGYVYVANAGSNSITVVSFTSLSEKVIGNLKLPAGAAPYDVAFAQLSTATPAPSPTPAPTASPTPTATPAPTTHLYVANGSAGNVLEYTAPFSSSSAPSVNVKIGGNVWGVASDSKYVAVEDSTGYIYIFNAPLTSGSSPVAQFHQFQGGVGGAQLLFDSNGNLYTGTQGSMVFEYSPPFSNASTPSKTINGDNSSFSLSMDYLGNLYVGNLGVNQIDVFASPYTSAPTSAAAPGTYGLASYATYLFGADALSGVVDVYNLPMNASSTPAYAIANTDPHALAVDGTGTLYVGDQHGGTGTGSVDAYAQPLSASSKAAYSITSGLVEPVELWLGP